MRVLGLMRLGLLIVCLGVMYAPAAEVGLAGLYECRIPPVIATFSGGGQITEKDLLRKVIEHVRKPEHPLGSVFANPQRFIVHILQIKALKTAKSKVIGPEQLREFIRRWQEYVAKLKPEQAAKLPGNSDIVRKWLRDKLVDSTGITPINADKYDARWFGLEGRIVANIEGRDYTDYELARYLVCWSSDAELEGIISDLLRQKILAAEAERMGINVKGLSADELGRKVFAPLITQQALGSYYQSVGKELAVMKLREFRFDYASYAQKLKGIDHNSEESRPGVVAQIEKVRSEAKNLAVDLKSSAKISETAKNKFKYVYLCRDGLLAKMVTPYAYGLDFIYNADGAQKTPISMTPKYLEHLWNSPWADVVSGPYDTGKEFLVYQIVRLYQPRNPALLSEYLAQKRINRQTRRLIEAVGTQVQYNFTAKSRLKLTNLPPESAQN